MEGGIEGWKGELKEEFKDGRRNGRMEWNE